MDGGLAAEFARAFYGGDPLRAAAQAREWAAVRVLPAREGEDLPELLGRHLDALVRAPPRPDWDGRRLRLFGAGAPAAGFAADAGGMTRRELRLAARSGGFRHLERLARPWRAGLARAFVFRAFAVARAPSRRLREAFQRALATTTAGMDELDERRVALRLIRGRLGTRRATLELLRELRPPPDARRR